MFSLCIPTMNRFDDFLIHNIPKYLENNLIDEIVITDENGKDIEKIKHHFGENNPKLKLFKNEHRLGPFMNKLRACSYAKNEWIALIDSDNFADEDYFMTSKNYIETKIQKHEKNVILSPIPNIPNLNFSILEGMIYKKGCFPRSEYFQYTILMNTGNYIMNKYLIECLDLSNETTNIQNSPTCDVIFMNTLFFEQLDLNFHVVPELKYTHVIHDLSIYKQLGELYKDFNESIRQRHFCFIENPDVFSLSKNTSKYNSHVAKNFWVTIFGTCRFKKVDYNTNLNEMISYTHTTKEVLQLISFLKGEIVIPPPYNTLCFRTAIDKSIGINMDNHYKSKFDNTKVFFIELCSRKKYIHNNYILHHICVDKRMTIFNNNTPRHILDTYTIETQSDEEIENDILEIQKILYPRKVVIVSHYNSKLNGEYIESRNELVCLLDKICQKHNISFINPREALGQYSQEQVMSDNLGHYTEFGLCEFGKYINNYIKTLV
jgi:hypothetical protein